MLDWLKKLFKQTNDLEKTIDDAQAQAEMVTKVIPGAADDKFVDRTNKQVDEIQGKFDDIKKNIPGQGR